MSNVVPRDLMTAASTLDTLSMDLLIFLAPLLVALGFVAATGGGAIGAVTVVGALALIGVALFLAPPSSSAPDRPSPTARPILQTSIWSLFSGALGFSLAVIEIGAVGLVTRNGLSESMSWLVFLVLAASAVAGGLLDTATSNRFSRMLRLSIGSVTMAAGSVLVALAAGLAPTVLGLVLIGLPTAMLLGLRSNRFDDLPQASRASALIWTFAAQNIGFAVGASVLVPPGNRPHW